MAKLPFGDGPSSDRNVNPREDAPAGPAADGAAGPEGLARAAGFGRGGPPPLHQWNPPFCGDIDMVIRRDGTWHYRGTPIGRPAMVRLFASILRREGDRFVLVTPAEKVGIRVEDAPFVAVDCDAAGTGAAQVVTFTTSLGDRVDCGPDHPLRVAGTADAPAPYVTVRPGLEARLDRKTFYRLADLCEDDGSGRFGLRSGGAFFPVLPPDRP